MCFIITLAKSRLARINSFERKKCFYFISADEVFLFVCFVLTFFLVLQSHSLPLFSPLVTFRFQDFYEASISSLFSNLLNSWLFYNSEFLFFKAEQGNS